MRKTDSLGRKTYRCVADDCRRAIPAERVQAALDRGKRPSYCSDEHREAQKQRNKRRRRADVIATIQNACEHPRRSLEFNAAGNYVYCVECGIALVVTKEDGELYDGNLAAYAGRPRR